VFASCVRVLCLPSVDRVPETSVRYVCAADLQPDPDGWLPSPARRQLDVLSPMHHACSVPGCCVVLPLCNPGATFEPPYFFNLEESLLLLPRHSILCGAFAHASARRPGARPRPHPRTCRGPAYMCPPARGRQLRRPPGEKNKNLGLLQNRGESNRQPLTPRERVFLFRPPIRGKNFDGPTRRVHNQSARQHDPTRSRQSSKKMQDSSTFIHWCIESVLCKGLYQALALSAVSARAGCNNCSADYANCTDILASSVRTHIVTSS
jgi:hypothetical protein